MDWFRRLERFWVFRSVAVGALATVLDYSLLLLGVEALHLPRVPMAFLSASAGAVVGFLLNRAFAFRDTERRIGPQAVRYTLLVGGELLLHSGLMSAMVHALGLYYVLAKLVADATVFGCIHLVMLRYVVFPKTPTPAPLTPAALE